MGLKKKKAVKKKMRIKQKISFPKNGRTLVLRLLNDKKKPISEVLINSLDLKTTRTLSGMTLGLTNKKKIVFPSFQKDEGYVIEIELCEINGVVLYVFDLGSPLRADIGVQPQLLPKALALKMF